MIMEERQSQCQFRLRKIRPSTRNKDVNTIAFSENKPVVIGRVIQNDVNTVFLSKTTPLMISRRHATVSAEAENRIFVVDHSSLNGVYINKRRIKARVKTEIKVGDIVYFGCGVEKAPPEFEYILELVPHTLRCKSEMLYQGELIRSPAKRKRMVEPPSVTIIESNTAQIFEQEQKIKNLTESLKEKENTQEKLLSQLQETESGMLQKLEEQKTELEQKRQEAEQHLKSLLEQQLAEKEDRLRSQFDTQIRDLEMEKALVEQNLQQELSKQLSEKDQAYQKALEQQKLELENTIAGRETEKQKLIEELNAKESLIEKYKSVEENQKQLEECLEELRKEINNKENQLIKQKEVTKKVESDAKQTVIQSMEDEFTCIICSELFIEATTLPCAHTFCDLCLKLWLKKKKNCPVCRRRMKGKAVRSIVLDSVVEKVLESLGEDDRKRRVQICKEREAQKKKDDATEGNNVTSKVEGAFVPFPNLSPHQVIEIDDDE